MMKNLNGIDNMDISDSQAVPPQQEGGCADIVETIRASNIQEAKLFFVQVKGRLFDVANWGGISSGISASFALTDKDGNIKYRLPDVGDHIRINIPGPGTVAGEGYDWVRIEIVEQISEPDWEFCFIKVRPSEEPAKKEGTAHFFESQATSTFIIRREGVLLVAEIHGRNEMPNTGSRWLTDNIRNMLVSTAATGGLAKIQWQKLAKGLLNFQQVPS